jgi:hypothetical protein
MGTITSSATASGLQLTNTGGTASSWIIQSDGGAVSGQAALRFYSLTASAYRMSIDGSGNVGIGITSPSQLLHLQTTLEASSGVGTAIQIESGGAGGDMAWIGVNKGTGNGLEFSVENRDIIFNTGATTPFGGSERMRITSGGNVGIGVSSPDIFSRGDERMIGMGAACASDNLALALNAGGSAGRGAQIYMGQGGTRHLTISSNATETRVGTTTSTPLILTTNDTTRLTIASTGVACFACELTAKSLGTNDLILNNLNHEHANYVDGTRGSWLIQEGACDLFIINQVSCKKYKFNLIEIN